MQTSFVIKVRLYPGAPPELCRYLDGQIEFYASEYEAEQQAKLYRESVSKYSAVQPHYFVSRF